MTMCPIILGGGKPLFKDVKERQPLRLAGSTPSIPGQSS
jgi:hypothetical protein